jgi:hypothetical protein
MKSQVTAVVALLLLAAASAPAAEALRAPRPTGTCNCKKRTGVPQKYKPVCGNDLVTYGNECVAKCANVLIRNNGKCPTCRIRVGNCVCNPLGYRPVCSFGLTFSNSCDALCGGYACPLESGVCRYSPRGSKLSTRRTGRSVRAAAGNSRFPSTKAARYSYTRAVHLGLIFFESMRSGTLDRQRLAWRSDSCVKCRGPSGENLSQGYYEAGGSFLKLGLVESFLVTMLADSGISFANGYRKANDLGNLVKAVDWGVAYLVKAHSRPDRFVAVLGNDTLDFDYYNSVERYDQYVPKRTTCYIDRRNRGSEIAGEAAAALASAALMYRRLGVKRSTASYITHAKQLYNLAVGAQGSYADANSRSCLGIHKRLYASTRGFAGYGDELAWAAANIYRATKEGRYLRDARNYYGRLKQPAYAFEVGNKTPALNVLMQEIDPSNAGRYFGNAQRFFDQYLNQQIPHTPNGLAYPYHFGALRPTTQMAYLALRQAKLSRSRRSNLGYAARLFNYATFQLNYVLGDGGRTYLAGYSKSDIKFYWHKMSYNSYITDTLRGVKVYAGLSSQKTDNRIERRTFVWAAKFDMEGSFSPQRFTPYGALYGAPLQDDGVVWGRKDYSYTEPTADGNAAVTGAYAALAEYYSNKQGKQNDCGLNLGWSHPGARATKKSVNNIKACRKTG